MCLIYSKKATSLLRRKMNRHGGVMDFYKIYNIGKNCLVAPYKYVKIKSFGKIVSNRKVKTFTTDEKIFRRVNEGIHIYITPPAKYLDSCKRCVKIRCRVKDLVGASSNKSRYSEAVFMKVYLPKKEWDKVFKK